MLNERLGECVDEAFEFLPVVVFGLANSDVGLEPFKSRRERFVLFDVFVHQPWNAGEFVDAGEEFVFFRLVVVVHGLAPALTVGQEVAHCRLIVAR